MEKPTLVRELTTGQKVPMPRLDLRSWITFGLVPEFFVRQIAAVQSGEGGERELNEDETIEYYCLARNVFAASVAPFKIVVGGTAADEIDPAKLNFEKDVLGTLTWQFAGAPGVPVNLTGGEITSVETLGNFRPKRGGKKPARVRRDVQGVG
jgi:hypothetical protein